MVVQSDPAGGKLTPLVERAQNLILRPTQEWERIDGESPSPQALLLHYVLPLALIPAVAGLIGGLVFGYGGFGISFRPSPVFAVTSAVVTLVFTLVGVFILAFVINALAPTFKGEKNSTKALQVAAYSGTAGYLAGIFQIFPLLGVFGLLGLLSLYTLFRGLPKLMRAPSESALGYTAAVLVCALVLGVLAGAIAGAVTAPLRFLTLGGVPSGQVEINLPGGQGTIDVGDLEAAGKRMEEAVKQMDTGQTGAAIDVERLKSALPESLPGGFSRTEVSTGATSAGGFATSGANATYVRGDETIRLSVGDLGPMAAAAAFAGAMGIEASTETADGYKRTRKEGDRFVIEEVSQSAGTAEYAYVQGRIVVSAEGSGGVPIDMVRAAATGIDAGKLQAP